MKASFIRALTELAEKDKDIVLITGDLGFGVFEPFEERFPDQYFNVGIAEQSMIGIACGLAKAGKKVFVYSIGNFVTLRCLEQIRNDAIYHGLNVNLVCQGGGFTYGQLGVSHHATEDLAIIRALPEVVIVAPSNTFQVIEAVKKLNEIQAVSYLRLEKVSNGKQITSEQFSLGKPVYIDFQADVLIIAIGSIVSEALEAQLSLSDLVKVSVLDFHTLRPYDKSYVLSILKQHKLIISLEEHQINGGLGSLLAEIIVESQLPLKLKRMGIDNKLISEVGDQNYLRSINYIDSVSIIKYIKEELSID